MTIVVLVILIVRSLSMESQLNTEPQEKKGNIFLGIPSFWKRQMSDWKITVIRTSLERFGYQVIYPYLSIFIVALGATKANLGVVTSIGMLLAGLLGPYTGQFIDKNGPRKIYLLGIAILMVSYLTYGFANSWQICAAALIIYYLASGTSMHSCATICGNCLVNKDRARGMLVCESLAAGLLGMAGPMLAAFVLVNLVGVIGAPTSAGQIRPLFFISASITFISFLLVFFKLSNHKWMVKDKTKTNVIKDAKILLKGNKLTKKWLAIGALGTMPMGMILPYVQLFAKEAKGADVTTLATMVTAAALTSVVFGYSVGALADKIGRKKVLAMIIPMFWLSNLLLVFSPSPILLVVAGVLQGFYYIASPLTATIQREIVPQELMGRWIGLNRFVSAFFSAFIALISGFIYDGLGPQYVFLIFVGIDALIRMPLLMSMPETLHFKIPTPKQEA